MTAVVGMIVEVVVCEADVWTLETYPATALVNVKEIASTVDGAQRPVTRPAAVTAGVPENPEFVSRTQSLQLIKFICQETAKVDPS